MVNLLDTESREDELKARKEAAGYIKYTDEFTFEEAFPMDKPYPRDRESRPSTGDRPDSHAAFPR
jgi:hypothetical protein